MIVATNLLLICFLVTHAVGLSVVKPLTTSTNPCTTFVPHHRRRHHHHHPPTPVLTTRSYPTSTTRTTSSLNLFPKKKDTVPKLKLTPEEDDALRSASDSLIPIYGYSWFEKPDAYAQLKTDYPILASYSDLDLKEAYVKQKPKLLDLIVKTPLGPFTLVNVIAWATGFSWCDTPFHFDGACPPTP